MIIDALNYLRDEMIFELGLAANEVIIQNLQVLKDENNPPGLYISLFNVEQEYILKKYSPLHPGKQSGPV